MSDRFCPACGARVPEDARFCTECGKDTISPPVSNKEVPNPGTSDKKDAPRRSSLVPILVGGIAIVVVILIVVLVVLPKINKGSANNNLSVVPTSGSNSSLVVTTGHTTTSGNVIMTSPWSDIPLYSGARQVQGDWTSIADTITGSTAGMKWEWHFHQINDSDVASAISFYKSSMPGAGWQYLTDTTSSEGSLGNTTMVMYMKGSTDWAMIMTFKNTTGTGSILGLARGGM